jgi:hypothetical protein
MRYCVAASRQSKVCAWVMTDKLTKIRKVAKRSVTAQVLAPPAVYPHHCFLPIHNHPKHIPFCHKLLLNNIAYSQGLNLPIEQA